MKTCFVICPFGDVDSIIRERSDYIFSLISQAVKPRGYQCDRTIDDPHGGPVGNQIISALRQSELVIADLTSLNPNVMYELALRHATGKPYIHLIEKGTKIPFDISTMNVINIDPQLDQGKEILHLINNIGQAVDKIEAGDCDFSNPAMESAGDLMAQYFIWEVSFRESLHLEWLKLQDEHTQEFIRAFTDEGVDLAKSNETQLKKLAEYQAMNERANSVMRGHMFYFSNRRSGAIMEGWVVFDEVNPLLALTIRGEHLRESISIRYKQPHWPQVVKGESVNVGPYNYSIEFKDINGNYCGELYHPEEFRGGRLMVAKTHLLRSPGLMLGSG